MSFAGEMVCCFIEIKMKNGIIIAKRSLYRQFFNIPHLDRQQAFE